jgi:hypothetical protein
MRPIPTKVHGILDYLTGALLIAAPWLFNFSDHDTARWVAIGMGLVFLGQSIFTNYEMGLVRRIPMSAHLTLDVLGGALLVASPWLLGFSERVYLPHLLVGLLAIGSGLLTQRVPGDEQSPQLGSRN